MKLLMLITLMASLAAAQIVGGPGDAPTTAQTTYNLTAAALCNENPGPIDCTYHLGSEFGIPIYWAAAAQSYFSNGSQLFFQCANPASGNWSQTVENPVPLNTPVTFTFGCSDSTGTHNMSAAFQAHKQVIHQSCGRYQCPVTKWIIDSGFLTVQ